MGSSVSSEEASSNNEQPQSNKSTPNISVDTTTSERAHITNNTLKLPHNYEIILKDGGALLNRSSTEKLFDQLYAGVYLKEKRQKYWVDKKVRNFFMVFAKELLITWADDARFWHWPLMNESGDVSLPAAEMLNVCWLEIHGKFNTVKCSPGALYEVVFIVMLKDPAYGWETPVNLRLILPDGSKQEHKENLSEKLRGQWIEIQAGEFTTSMENNTNGELEFSLYEYEGGKWKRGLVIKGVSIRPKS